MELGSVANIYQPNQATYEAELAACQRYLPAMTTNGANGQNIMGYSYATNSGIYSVGFNVTARVAPTGITQPGVGNFICFNSTNGNASMTNLIFDSAGLNGASVASTATLTAGQPSRILIGATGYILFTGCEL